MKTLYNILSCLEIIVKKKSPFPSYCSGFSTTLVPVGG